jgi:signal transduction histidine kinase
MASPGPDKRKEGNESRPPERESSESSDFLARLASRLSHKVSNSLVSSLNYAFILKEMHKDADTREMVKSIESGVGKAAAALHAFADACRPDCGGRGTVALDSILAVVVDTVSPEARDQGVALTTECARGVVVETRADGLREALSEVVRNALEAKGKRVDVRGFAEEGSVVLTVQDDGQGMEAEDITQACEPFFTRKPGSLGLGLFRVSRIMEVLGGEVKLSGASGQGTLAVLTVPKRS